MSNKNKNKNKNNNKKNYYLVDYENVGVKGLEGAEHLNDNDYVHLFSTRNAPKITTAILATFNSTNFKVHEVPVKNQSVDMHLVSYLGYLIGTDGTSSNYVIISKDNDYLNIIKYWKNENNIPVTIQDNLVLKKSNTNGSNSERQTKKDSKSSKSQSMPNSPPPSPPNNSKSKNKGLNNFKNIIRTEFKNYRVSNNNINKIIKIVSTHYGNEKFLMLVHNDLQKTFEDVSEIYDVIKAVYNSASADGTFSYSPKPVVRVFRTDLIFQGNKCVFPENYEGLISAMKEELAFYGYTKDETSYVVNNLFNIHCLNRVEYFKNLATVLHENFHGEQVCEIFNIVKAMLLGDLNYPGIVSMTFGNGKHFSKPSPTLEMYKILNPIYTRLQANLKGKLYPDQVDGVSDIVIKYYLEDNHEKLIRNEIISTYGAHAYNVAKDLI